MINVGEFDRSLRDGRREQAKLFFERATVIRRTGPPEFDPETGQVTSPTEIVYSGPCAVLRSVALAFGQDRSIAETQTRVFDWVARFPVDTPLEENDLVRVDASRYDQGLVDRWFKVNDVLLHGRQMSRDVIVEDLVVAPDDLNLGV